MSREDRPADVRLIAAVGRRGQLGLDGRIPWNDPEDLRWFREQTFGGIVILGERTRRAVGPLPGRTVVPWKPQCSPDALIDGVRRLGPTIWIAGGAATYAAFMPFVRRAVVTLVDYDGPADAVMPPLWSAAPEEVPFSG